MREPEAAYHRRRRVLLWCALAVFASVGVVFVATAFLSEPASGYDDGLRKDFVSSCRRAGGDDASDTCGCSYDKVAGALPFERFREIDRQLRDGGALPEDVRAMVASCR